MLSPSFKKPFKPEEKLAFRVLDANFNRAVEGLRVVEEYARFVVSSPQCALQLKTLRHEISSICEPYVDLWASQRDSQEDIGTNLSTAGEYQRNGFKAIIAANLGRVGQALRSIEEYAKAVCPEIAPLIESQRYLFYDVEKNVKRMYGVEQDLRNQSLYVLTSGCSSLEAFKIRVEALCAAGADLIQLREKNLSDSDLLQRARSAVEICANVPTLLIVNDRPDVALMSGADGVHLGQEEFRVQDVQKILPVKMLIGVSTHSLEQAIQAEKDGADYIGVGPTFASQTKCFTEFKGTELLEVVAQNLSIPAFAIGGIDLNNLSQVTAAGFNRVAVSNAVHSSESPAETIAMFKKRLWG
jgi:thiamine-phosphate pyrophosphorylase